MLAAGDADYSVGEDIYTGRLDRGSLLARHAFLRAAEEYLAAYTFASPDRDATLRMTAAWALSSTYYYGIKDWQRTSEWGARASDLATRLGDSYAAARAGYLDSAGWIEAPQPPSGAEGPGAMDAHTRLVAVRKRLNEVVAYHERRHEEYDAAIALGQLGESYGVEGDYAEAAKVSARQVRIFHRLHETASKGAAIQGMAWNEWGLGKLAAAERHFREAIELCRTDAYVYMFAVSNFADLEHVLGRLDDALRLQTEALRLAEKLQLRLPIGHNLYSLGATYYALGDLDQSIYYFERAVNHSRSDPHIEASNFRALATAYRDAGRPADARKAAEEALTFAFSEPARARIQIAIATDNAALGHTADALALLDSILSRQTANLPDIRVEGLIARARVDRLNGQPNNSIADLKTALEILKSIQAPVDEFQANLELARTELVQARLTDANAAADRALSIGQLLRRQTASPELRARRQEPLRPAYDLKIAVLMALRREQLRRGDLDGARATERQALVTAENSRAQALRDFALLDYSRRHSAVAGHLQRQAELYKELGSILGQLDYRTDDGDDNNVRVTQSRAAIADLRRELDALNARIAAEAGGGGPAAVADPDAWRAHLSRSAADALVVEYWIGTEGAYCWTISSDGIRFFDLGDARSIDAAARAMHAAMRETSATPSSVRVTAASALAELILRPLAGELEARKLLIVVPDQALSYVSFPALVVRRSPQPTFLIETHEIETAPAAWWLFREGARSVDGADRGILIVADPIYDSADRRLTVAHADRAKSALPSALPGRTLNRLPFTAQEADAVARQFPTTTVRRLEGSDATRSRFLAEPLGRYRYIHIASHGNVDSRMPQLASLVLSEYDDNGPIADPAIHATDLMPLNLHAEVVALSACDTALGKDVVGEGAMGLGYAALARGAHAVLASLWSVSDEISSDVMTDFYRAIREKHAAPASALAAAMRDVLKKRPALDPAFWAAYQLTVSAPPETRESR
jgi:CHAT domain-containing protein